MRELNSRASMLDVASRAGVSKTTVSYVLNGKTGVSEETKARVLKACEEIGYRINPNIQDFIRETVSGSTRNLAFVLVGKDFADPAYSRLIDGIALGTEENNYHLLFAKLTGAEESVYDLPTILRDRRVDGVLISGEVTSLVLSTLGQLEMPCIVLGNYSDRTTRGFSVVGLSQGGAVQMVMEQLRLAGHSRIAFCHETLIHFADQELLARYKDALTSNDLEVSDDIIYIGKGPLTGAMEMMKPVFRLDELPFDAIYCPDFRLAIEISHLIMAREWSGKPSNVILATIRPYSYYKLPVRAIYMDMMTEEIAYQGVELLLENITQGENFRHRKIALTPVVTNII